MAWIQERKKKNGKITYTATVRIRVRKQLVTKTATFDSKRRAKEWVAEMEYEIKKGKYSKNSDLDKYTVADMIDRYLEDVVPGKFEKERDREGVKRHLTYWREKIGKTLLMDTTPGLIIRWRDKLKKEPYVKFKRTSDKSKPETPAERKARERERSNGTVNRYVGSLSSVFSYAISWGWIEENPVSKVKKLKEPRGRVRFLSEEEHTALLDACKVDDTPQDKDKKEKRVSNPNLYIVVVIALTTGARFSEIMNLKWDDVDFNRRLFYFLETKNKERRSVPISQHAYDLLVEHKHKRVLRLNTNTKLVFPGTAGNKPLELKRQWENAVERAGLEDFRFHDLRHTAASYLAMNGASLLEIAHILGHRTLEMTKRYSHLTNQHTAGVLERINDAQFNKKEKA